VEVGILLTWKWWGVRVRRENMETSYDMFKVLGILEF